MAFYAFEISRVAGLRKHAICVEYREGEAEPVRFWLVLRAVTVVRAWPIDNQARLYVIVTASMYSNIHTTITREAWQCSTATRHRTQESAIDGIRSTLGALIERINIFTYYTEQRQSEGCITLKKVGK